jgi:signal transduction histidine kinase
LIDLGLYAAIRNDFRKHQKFFGIEMSFWNSEKLPEYRFREGLEVNLYRMVQELVQNTLKHADATSISLVMLIELECFVVRYEDNGKGMSPAEPLPRVLQYRADLMNAKIERTHGARGGLAYRISIPMENLFYVTDQSLSS